MPQHPSLRIISSQNFDNEPVKKHDLIVIANKEPYIHQKLCKKAAAIPANLSQTALSEWLNETQIIRPASGLVSGLEPMLKQHGGLWIAHGSGNADFEFCNTNGEVQVPPENPRYTLKRLKLSELEELGYYYGFSNEGLWPLCHLAHIRPIFRLQDWQYYQSVSERFTDAIPEEKLKANSIILVQDYHFALVPQMLRRRSEFLFRSQMNSSVREGNPKIGIFWHIPWPNPETFGICPWGKELLEGMLGADIIGFHTQYHCNNFLETCNRYLEARIDLERFSVTMNERETLVKAFPIGIDTAPIQSLSSIDKLQIKKRYGITAPLIAIGVDRLDYTKGLIERIEAVERFLEKNPEYIGKFTLLQIGSPTRTHINAYQRFYEQLNKKIQAVNARFTFKDQPEYKPILFLSEHHDWHKIQSFYQLGDVCMVTSLHDGMNLVAKEYVWCQQSEFGSLILSKFTGASRELHEAFIINPYDIEQMAHAIEAALTLPSAEKARRMNAMKEKVLKQNAYQWASDQINALTYCGLISSTSPSVISTS